MSKGEIIEGVGDDPETMHDMPALCERLGVELLKITENSGEYTFQIQK